MTRLFRLLFILLTIAAIPAVASDIYVAQSSAGGNTGANCANARAGSSLIAGDWVAGNTIHLCGTWTGAANQSPFITALGNGSAGNPITIFFEAGAILQAPYFLNSQGGTQGGAITLQSGRSWIVIDGNNKQGTIQNTANGSSLANQQTSAGISAFGCSNCTIKNLNIFNIYVNVAGNGTIGDSSLVIAVDFSGSNWTVSGNLIHDCGWCLRTDYANGDTNYSIFNNEIYNQGHGYAFATAHAGSPNCTSPCLLFHDNYMHDTANWDGVPPYPAGCFSHQDGIHMFGTGTSTAGDIYVYNNKFSGNWGNCPTGFVYLESLLPANTYFFNNVGIVNSNIVNSNGWFGLFSAQNSGQALVTDNTIVGQTSSDNSQCFSIGAMNNVTFKNNVVAPCGTGLQFKTSNTGTTKIDYNFYGAQNGSNGMIWHGSFFTYTNWKTACSCDAHSLQNNNNGLLNSDGTPTPSSPFILEGDNLGSLASGNLAPLQNDTTAGNNRTALTRPAAASCTSQGTLPCWDIGAFQFASSAPAPAPDPAPIVIAAVPLPTQPASPVIVSVSPTKTYVTKNGCSQEGTKWLNPCVFALTCTSCDGTTQVTLDGFAVGQTYANGVMTVSVPLSVLPVPSQITLHNFAATNPTISVPVLTRSVNPTPSRLLVLAK